MLHAATAMLQFCNGGLIFKDRNENLHLCNVECATYNCVLLLLIVNLNESTIWELPGNVWILWYCLDEPGASAASNAGYPEIKNKRKRKMKHQISKFGFSCYYLLY